MADLPTTETLIASLKKYVPMAMGDLTDAVKNSMNWPTERRLNALAPSNIEDFFKQYFDTKHIQALEAAAAQKPGSIVAGVLPYIKPYENQLAAKQVKDPQVITAAMAAATPPAPAVTPTAPVTPAPPVLPAAPVVAATSATFQFGNPVPPPVPQPQLPPVAAVPPPAPAAAAQPPAAPAAPSAGAVANPAAPGRLPSGEYANDDDAPGPKKKGKDWGALMEQHPMLAGMGIGLAVVAAKAATGKASFDDLFLFLAIGALAGFMYDKFNKMPDKNNCRDDQYNRLCENDQRRGCAPRDLPPAYCPSDVRIHVNNGYGNGVGGNPTHFPNPFGHGNRHC